jgi:hypothetical protein
VIDRSLHDIPGLRETLPLIDEEGPILAQERGGIRRCHGALSGIVEGNSACGQSAGSRGLADALGSFQSDRWHSREEELELSIDNAL